MNDTKYYESIKRDLIPKLLTVIETHEIDMMHAEQIPMFLEKAIKYSNFEQTCRTKFKGYSQAD